MRVTLNGIVASDEDVEIYQYFGYSAFGPQTVRQAIADNPAGEELVLEINSPGGSVMAGSEMYTVLRSAEGVHTRAEIQSMAASAASYMCLGCNEVWISPVAQMMVHLPSTCTAGDRVEHMRSVQMLDSTREAILNAYELKAGGKADRAELRRLMSASTWLTAQDAVDKGLADGILFEGEGPMPQNLMNAVGVGIRALGESGGMPDIVSMRDAYRKANEQPPAEPSDPTKDWRVKARLELEKIRLI